MLYLLNTYALDEMPSIFITDNPNFSSERMFYKDYCHNGSVAKKIPDLESQGA
jgi:hypothetical protein